jgi:hypothetical protein
MKVTLSNDYRKKENNNILFIACENEIIEDVLYYISQVNENNKENESPLIIGE